MEEVSIFFYCVSAFYICLGFYSFHYQAIMFYFESHDRKYIYVLYCSLHSLRNYTVLPKLWRFFFRTCAATVITDLLFVYKPLKRRP